MSKKILSQQQQSNYDLVSHYLDIVFLAPDTVDLLKTDSSFRKVIQDDINIVSYYENEFEVTDTKATKFIQAYHVITKEHAKINDDYKDYSDDSNVEDMINYTNVYVNNVLGKSINDIAESLKAKNSEPQEAEIKDEKVEAKENSDDDGYTNSYSQESDEDILNRSGYSMHDVADQLVQQQASILLNKNIATGKVYAFTSKPKLIPIVKWLTVAAMALILAFSIASFAILMCTNGKIQMPVLTFTPGNEPGTGSWAPTSYQPATLMTPFPFQLLMVLLIVIMVIMSMVRNKKNDNFKYRYSWGWMIFYILMILMVTLIASGVQNSLVFNFDGFKHTISQQVGNITNPNYSDGKWSTNAQYALNLIQDWRILQFVIYGLIGLTIVCTVTGAVFNPKRDYERLQALLNQYVVEIRNGQVSSDDLGGNGGLFGSPFFGGFF